MGDGTAWCVYAIKMMNSECALGEDTEVGVYG